MQRIAKDEYDATHRIFNKVERIIGPYTAGKLGLLLLLLPLVIRPV